MAIIYTNQSSGAIRRMKRRKPTKAYLEAVKKHVKYLKKLGFDVDNTGRIKLTTNGRYAIDVVSRMIKEDIGGRYDIENQLWYIPNKVNY